MNLSRCVIGAGVIAVLVGPLIAVTTLRPASAQGGLLCDVGPADYRRCCKDSYQRHAELGLRARAEDIDACMKGVAREEPAADRREGDREPIGERDRAGDRNASDRASPQQNPQPTPPVVLRGTGASPIRRITCASEPCEKGCAADEMAISAFCNIGSFPTLAPDGAVRCATTGSGSALPIVLFCARR